MLAGDLAGAMEVVGEVGVATETTTSPTNLVFIDPTVPQLDELVSGIAGPNELILLDANREGLEQITSALRGRTNVAAIHVIAHGQAGQIQLGNQTVDQQKLIAEQSSIQTWQSALTNDADILLYSCETGRGSIGEQFVAQLARLTRADVAASVDVTGVSASGGDWDLERTVGLVETSLVVDASVRDRYRGTLAISIRAAGQVGVEEMQLLIDGNVAQTWTVGGDARQGEFETFTYDVDGVDVNDIRIAFTNDLFDPANNIDRNLRVDWINVDGVTYQTEHPSVFSTGTWTPSGGATGNFESEYLHRGGYFQYSDIPVGNGSLITITAEGNEGDEDFSLLIDGVAVQSWSSVGTTANQYVYQADSTVTADQVRIEFTNDLYAPEIGYDRNLTIDHINIDGTTYETEAPTVFSTGTWVPGLNIVPGFHQRDTLHGFGYFQYDAGPAPQPGEIGLTLDSLTIDEDLGTLNFVVFRGGGADGAVTVDYGTVAESADGNDFTEVSGTLTFADGVTGQQVSLQINDDSITEPDESFRFVLSNPTGGATLAAITSQQVTIHDNDDIVAGVIFADSFESVSNWVTDPFGTDTATTGQWEIGSPQQTTSGSNTIQFGSGHTGPGALVTGLAAGSSLGSFDIDSGPTSVLSPEIDLPAGAEIELAFEYSFAYLSNGSNDDYFSVSIVADGNTTELFSDHAHNSLTPASWTDASFDISQYAGQTIQILFEAADAAGGSLIEAAVDDVVVEVLPNLPGTIEVVTTGVNVDEAAGVATVIVGRNNGREGEVTVNYTTVAGSASSGDFTPVSGTLFFADGQAEQTVNIPIIDDAIEEQLESFQLVISNATGGAQIGTDSSASITIADNDSSTPDYLPDLTPIASTLTEALSIDTSEIPGRTLLRFSTEVANAGDGPLEIWGGSVSGSSQQVFQRIYQEDGGSRDVLAGEFVYHAGHGHIHFEGFATYDLILRDGSGNIVASGGKTSFCLINIRQPLPDVSAAAGLVHGRGGNSCGQVQGISAGYSDVYSAALDDQWIDVTGVANGNYWLEITADPENNITETDETNNSARVQITLNNGQVSF